MLGLAEALADRRGISLQGLPLRLSAMALSATATSTSARSAETPADEAAQAAADEAPDEAAQEGPCPGAGDGPDVLGAAYEAALPRRRRRARGAFFTPRPIAEALVAEALDGLTADGPVRVCDPAVGGGAFLLAAGRALAGRGVPRRTVVTELLFGADLDPVAVAVCEMALVLWALEDDPAEATAAPSAPTAPALPGDHLVVGDGLDLPWRDLDLVVGNPPFLSQLHDTTARTAAERDALRRRYGDAAGGYADTAAVFLAAACAMVRPGGRVALVQPESLLAARDAGGARRAVLDGGRLRALWHAREPVFAAGVRVCAPVIEIGAIGAAPATGTTSIRRFGGAGFEPEAPVEVADSELRSWATWAPLVARSGGVPEVDLDGGRTLGEECRTTADFRDQYYGLVPFVSDAGEGPPLITSGLIDPGCSRWGSVPTRFAKRRWEHPRVDVAGLRAASAPMARWADARLVPKVLVATQTRVIEAAVDADGSWLPCTPVITVTGDRLWHAAAVLLAPPVSAWALRSYGGAALSSDAIKLSASQVLAAPLPVDHEAWATAAALLQAGAPVEQVGEVMCAAYAAPSGVYAWWSSRLPRRSSTRRAFASS